MESRYIGERMPGERLVAGFARSIRVIGRLETVRLVKRARGDERRCSGKSMQNYVDYLEKRRV